MSTLMPYAPMPASNSTPWSRSILTTGLGSEISRCDKAQMVQHVHVIPRLERLDQRMGVARCLDLVTRARISTIVTLGESYLESLVSVQDFSDLPADTAAAIDPRHPLDTSPRKACPSIAHVLLEC